MTLSGIVEITSNKNRNRIRRTPILILVGAFILLLFLSKIANATQNDIECLANNAAYEAAGQGVTAMANVIEVTINRANGKSICQVVYEKTTDGVCQFSWVCMQKRRVLTHREKKLAIDIARSALYGGATLNSPFTEDAQYFCVPKACKKWHAKSPQLERVGYDGAHVYYRLAS